MVGSRRLKAMKNALIDYINWGVFSMISVPLATGDILLAM